MTSMIGPSISPVDIFLAFALDAAIGDPRAIPHPVALIGRAITFAEGVLRPAMGPRAGGAVLAAAITVGVALIAWLALLGLRSAGGVLAVPAYILYIYLLSTGLALRGLVDSVRSVATETDPGRARQMLGLIVGRDTGGLSPDEVRGAAVESLAENASDGVVGPMLFMALGGLPLMAAYKAVNTLDSMVGYKNEKYQEFGSASARLDDLLNYIPARITGFLIVGAAYVHSGLDTGRAKSARDVMQRDGREHPSPNAGVPEAAMAGALGVRMGGPSTYGGSLVDKPYINAAGGTTDEAAAKEAIGITVTASLLGLILAAALAYLIGLIGLAP